MGVERRTDFVGFVEWKRKLGNMCGRNVEGRGKGSGRK